MSPHPSSYFSGATAIRLESIARTFTTVSGDAYTALRDTTLSVAEGSFLSIVGPSGCGKSTLLNIVAGLIAPTEGRVEVYGQPLNGINRRAAYMFQEDALLPWKTVLGNIMLGLVLRKIPKDDAEQRARRWVTRVGLDGFAEAFPYQLSGGMRKRAAMAQCWIVEPDILLMDEPFSALDIHTRQLMESELLRLWSESRQTVVFVTHDLEEAIALSDEVVVLSAGPESRVISQYPVELARPRELIDIRTQPEFMKVYSRIWADLKEEVLKSHAQPSTPAQT
jgi:NitT/TauT family transport system ATP-binding protein